MGVGDAAAAVGWSVFKERELRRRKALKVLRFEQRKQAEEDDMNESQVDSPTLSRAETSAEAHRDASTGCRSYLREKNGARNTAGPGPNRISKPSMECWIRSFQLQLDRVASRQR